MSGFCAFERGRRGVMRKAVLGALSLLMPGKRTWKNGSVSVPDSKSFRSHLTRRRFKNGFRECLDSRNQIIAPAELEIFYDSLPFRRESNREVVPPFALCCCNTRTTRRGPVLLR